MIKVKFQKVKKDAVLPKKATKGSAAYDVFTPDYCIVPRGRSTIKLGLKIAMPDNIQGMVEARSGYSLKGFAAFRCPILFGDFSIKEAKEVFKNYIECDGAVVERFDADVVTGKIDSDFRGEISVIINNRSGFPFLLNCHQRIAQITFQKVEEVEFEEAELNATERGEGGFGHSGK